MSKTINVMVRGLVLFAQLALLSCSSVKVGQTEKAATPTPEQSLAVSGDRALSSTGQSQAFWNTRIDSFEVRWTTNDLVLVGPYGNPSISMKDEATRQFETTKGNAGKIEDCSYNREIKLMSVVGHLMSIEDRSMFSYSFSAQGSELSGPYSDYTTLITIDTLDARDETGNLKPKKLEALFSKADIFRELVQDKSISRALWERTRGKMPASFDGLVEVLKQENGLLFDNYRYSIHSDFTNHFAFESVEGDRVTVRLALPASNRTNREYAVKYLTFETSPDLKDDLLKAARLETGFLNSDAGRLFGDNATRIEFRCR